MNKKFGAGGLLFVAISGLTASSTVGAIDSNSKTSGVSNAFKLIDYLTYEDQKNIYKDLTSNRFGFGGKELQAITKNDVSKTFLDLYKKDSKKFDSYIKDNYNSELLIYNFKNDPSTSSNFDTLLEKINSDLAVERENALKDGKDYLPPVKLDLYDTIRSDMRVLDYAYDEGSPLISQVDKTTIYSKIRENARKIGLNEEIINNSRGSLALIDSNITDPSTKRKFRTIVANTVVGEKNVCPESNSYLRDAAIISVVSGVALVYKFRKQIAKKISKAIDFIFGRKSKKDDSDDKNKKSKPENPLEPYPD